MKVQSIEVCPIHRIELIESHPADPENGPHPSDTENEWFCAGCEIEEYIAFMESCCLECQVPIGACCHQYAP